MNRNYLVALGLAIAALAGCDSPPKPLEVTEVQEIEATVIAADLETRRLVLRGPQGNELGLRAGPEVRNLAQVEVGDILRVSYYTGFVVAMAEPGKAGADMGIAAGRTEEGERPGAAVGESMRATVEILSVAQDGKAVSFRDPEGRLHSIDVPRPEGQAFAKKLKAGDLVDIQFTEAIAIGVVPAEAGA
ncbi:MAG: hypothetical protein ACN4GT_08815 [Gammaproteobacteria bacterium]